MSEAALQAIAERVRAHAGLRPPVWVLTARVRDRVRALGLGGPDAYLGRLAGPELDALIEALRVGETRFFRHRAHVTALERVVIPALAGARAAVRRVRAWSAGCASGEEAYTLALLLIEGLPGWEVDVLATDLSDEALAVARTGVYPEAALAPVPPAWRARWFQAAAAGRAAVHPDLAARVRFERRNLLEPFAGDKDLILCRNVLIYFDPVTRAETARRLVGALAPGGFLFVGYSETLRAEPGLEARRAGDSLVYRRAPPGLPAPPAPVALLPAPAPAAAPFAAAATAPARVRLTGSHEAPEAIAAELRAAIAGGAAALLVDLDGVDYLDDSVAPILRRAEAAATAAGVRFQLLASRRGPRRWLERHGFLGEEPA